MSRYIVTTPFQVEPKVVIPQFLPDGQPNVIELDDKTAESYGSVVERYTGHKPSPIVDMVGTAAVDAVAQAASDAEKQELQKAIDAENAKTKK